MIAGVTFSFPVLVGDIGGTNMRLARVDAPNASLGPVERLPTSQAGLAAALARSDARSVLLGVAGPAAGRRVQLTNADLVIDGPQLLRDFGFDQGLVVNDFEAEALGLAALGPADCRTIVAGASPGPRLVLGPGTGIGVGALLSVGGMMTPLGTEAGHIGFAPQTSAQDEILQALRARRGRVCVEDILCGSGLVRLHAVRTGEQATDSGAILAAAAADLQGAAAASVAMFWSILGAFAGDMALAFRATGGVWLTGDLLKSLAPLCRDDDFIDAFVDKPPYGDVLRAIPVAQVTARHRALAGLARLAANPSDYGLDYANRCWRA